MTISAKLLSILTIGFRGDVNSVLYKVYKGNWLRPLMAMFLTNQICLAIFSCFPYISLSKTCDLWGPFLAPGHNLNKLDRGPIGDATYQISRLYALWFQTKDFFMFYLYRPM